jgi:hypothetical protein
MYLDMFLVCIYVYLDKDNEYWIEGVEDLVFLPYMPYLS